MYFVIFLIAFSFDGISSKRSVRSIRSSRQSKRINYCETVGFEDETDGNDS